MLKQEGLTALMIASHNGYLAIVQLLVQKGANINFQNKVEILLYPTNNVPCC